MCWHKERFYEGQVETDWQQPFTVAGNIITTSGSHSSSVVSICVGSCNNMMSTEAGFLMNRKGFHSLRTGTVKVPSLIFFVVTLGTFRRQAAEDLRVYVRGQKMIDSQGCREESKHLCLKNLKEDCFMLQPEARHTFLMTRNLHRQSQPLLSFMSIRFQSNNNR